MARNYYSEEEILDGSADPSYSAVAFDEGGSPIAPPPGGTFDFNRYAAYAQPPSQGAVMEEFVPELISQPGDRSVSPQGVESIYLGPGVEQGQSSFDRGQELVNENQIVDAKARQYRGMSLYRQLRAGGASHEEAIMRAAPDLYANSPAGFTKAVTPVPAAPTSKTVAIRDEDGNIIGYQAITGKHVNTIKVEDRTGRLSDAEKGKLSLTKAEIGSAQSEINRINSNPNSDLDKTAPARMEAAMSKLERAKRMANDILSGGSEPVEEVAVKEVIRRDKSGRRAVFNADTREFIRYAN